jgi:5'-deoxynucleotidase YfbR-like HD superfamily hydrolase
MDNVTTTVGEMLQTSEDVYHDDPFIELQSGVWHLNSPYYEIGDIAHNLSQINRYTGAGNFPYNVAEHSVLVSLLMEHEIGGDPFEGLMHDASEAYINDLSSPVKGELGDYKRLEARIEGGIRAQFGLPSFKTNFCRKADHVALFLESYQLMPSRGAHYRDPTNARPIAAALREQRWRIHGYDWTRSMQLFMSRYNQLRKMRSVLVTDSPESR